MNINGAVINIDIKYWQRSLLSKLKRRFQCLLLWSEFLIFVWSVSPSTVPYQVASGSFLAWETGRGAVNMRAESSLRNWRGFCLTDLTLNNNSQGVRDRKRGGLWHGVLNNSLFQVPERSSQINFLSSWALYIFSVDAAHLWRQAAVKVLHPAAVYWINGLGGFPWGGGGRKQLPKHFSSF